MQEIRFNAALCRCAVAAAESHERAAFDACDNKTRYHSVLTRRHASLTHVPVASLAPLCVYYQAPLPAECEAAIGAGGNAVRCATVAGSAQSGPGSAGAEAAGAAGGRDGSKAPGTPTGNGATPQDSGGHFATGAAIDELFEGTDDEGGAPDAQIAPGSPTEQIDTGAAGLRSAMYAEQAESGAAVPHAAPRRAAQMAASDDAAAPRSPGAEQCQAGPATDGTGGCSERRSKRARVGSPCDSAASHDSGASRSAGESNAAEAEAVGPVEARADSEEPPANHQAAADAAGGDASGPASPGHDREEGSAPADEPDAFEQFLEQRSGARAAAGGGAAGAERLRPKVHAFVGELLEPLLARGNVTIKQYTEVLGRAVEKVLSVHGGAEDASFLQSEARRICRLVDKYVAFVKARGGAG